MAERHGARPGRGEVLATGRDDQTAPAMRAWRSSGESKPGCSLPRQVRAQVQEESVQAVLLAYRLASAGVSACQSGGVSMSLPR